MSTIVLCAVVAVSAPTMFAQSADCGITSARSTKDLAYPAIVRAARVHGEVIFLVNFALDGSVDKMNILSGPEMLRDAAETYVKGLRANEYSGPRECPIVISFAIGRETDKPQIYIERSDLQHVRITAETYPPIVQYAVVSK